MSSVAKLLFDENFGGPIVDALRQLVSFQREAPAIQGIREFVAAGTRDIFERLYAVRLDRLRESAECREVLRDVDSRRLLVVKDGDGSNRIKEDPSDVELLSSLGVEADPPDDVTRLVYVRPREEIKAAEEVAQRNPCDDFDKFEAIFERVQRELDAGERQTLKYQDNAGVKEGDLFILDGQKVTVAEMANPFVSDYGRPDRRLRVNTVR